jgi:hypothetical protein
MHQHPRPSPMTASPASSPRTNPTRTNNPREEGSHTRTNSDMPAYNEGDDGSGDSGVMPSNGPSKDSVKKLDQIIQVKGNGFYQVLPAVLDANELLDRISIQKQLSLCCNHECRCPSYIPRKGPKKSINGYVSWINLKQS